MKISDSHHNTTVTMKEKDEKLKQACRDFEAIFISNMLKTMRKTIPKSGFTESSNQKDIYNAMYDEQLASFIANGRKPMGIGEKLYQDLSRKIDSMP
jgi:flagellar protein FlgJ